MVWTMRPTLRNVRNFYGFNLWLTSSRPQLFYVARGKTIRGVPTYINLVRRVPVM